MFSLILAVACGALYWRWRRQDRRMLRNGVALVAALWFAVLAVAEVLAFWLPWTALLWLGLLALLPLAVVVLAGFLLANGATMLRREGRSLGNLLSLLAGLAVLVLPVLAIVLVLTLQPVAIGVAALLFFLCSYAGVVFLIFLAYSLAYGRMPAREAPAAVVVLGSQIIKGRVPPLLRSRLDKALAVYRAAPTAPLLIPSGGQGHDESRPEGAAMAEYLVAAGAPAADVIAEDRATTTAENLLFSAAVAADAGRSGPMVVVTNNYHVLRAALLSRKLGLDADVVGAPTADYFLPSAFLREFVAVVREHRVLHALLCLPFLLLTAGLTALLVMNYA